MAQYLTRQQIFDKSIGGIIAQGGAAVYYDGSDDRYAHGESKYNYGPMGIIATCCYRTGLTSSERACGIGQLIADENYKRSIERKPVSAIPDVHLVLPDIDISTNMPFLVDIQSCHDEATEAANNDEEFFVAFLTGARELAATYNLSAEILG